MIRKGVILAAGYGTRMLPVTRTVPKEMLPIVARPAIDLVVDELVEAGVTELLVIVSRRKKALEDHFDADPELEAALAGRPDRLAKARPPNLSVHFVRQRQMGGTGDALRLARTFAGDDPVLVAFPDDLLGAPNASRALAQVWSDTGAAVLGALDMTGHDVRPYGVIDATDDGLVRDIVEKPEHPPSSLVSIGRYVYTPELFEALDQTYAEHTDGEFHPMAAMRRLARVGHLRAAVLQCPRWDTGSVLGYLQAVVDHALMDPDVGPDVRAWLNRRLS